MTESQPVSHSPLRRDSLLASHWPVPASGYLREAEREGHAVGGVDEGVGDGETVEPPEASVEQLERHQGAGRAFTGRGEGGEGKGLLCGLIRLEGAKSEQPEAIFEGDHKGRGGGLGRAGRSRPPRAGGEPEPPLLFL